MGVFVGTACPLFPRTSAFPLNPFVSPVRPCGSVITRLFFHNS